MTRVIARSGHVLNVEDVEFWTERGYKVIEDEKPKPKRGRPRKDEAQSEDDKS